MNMHPTYRARRLRALAVAAAGLALLFFAMYMGGHEGARLLWMLAAAVVLACGVALRRAIGGVA